MHTQQTMDPTRLRDQIAAMHFRVIAVVMALIFVLTNLADAKGLRVESITEPAGVRIDVDPGNGSGNALLQIVDAATGTVIKTLHAGPLLTPQSFTVTGGPAGLPAGSYKVRYRSGVEVRFDSAVKRPDAKVPKWLNPTDITCVGDALYVFDAGEFLPETRPAFLNEITVTTIADKTSITGRFINTNQGALQMISKKGESQVVSNYETVLTPDSIALVKKMELGLQELVTRRNEHGPRIFKMDREGNLDTSFGNEGSIVLDSDRYLRFRPFGVDPVNGNVLLGSTGHELLVYDHTGKLTTQTIGGWEESPYTSKWCTPWAASFAFGPSHRLYIPGGAYANGRVYDRTKNGHDGILYMFTLPEYEGFDRYICGDGTGAFYTCGRADQVTKHFDNGKEVKIICTTPPTLKLARPTGGCAGGGLVWWVCHGPGYGPFWDSGGGGEVVLLWDTGDDLKLIDRFGVPGLADDTMEFLNPSAVAVNAQQTQLWVAEDGDENKEGEPKGNARVRRFAITAKYVEEALIEIK